MLQKWFDKKKIDTTFLEPSFQVCRHCQWSMTLMGQEYYIIFNSSFMQSLRICYWNIPLLWLFSITGLFCQCKHTSFVSAVMSGVSQLSTRDITETSVTLLWTPPRVQYETYYITFTSQVHTGLGVNWGHFNPTPPGCPRF